MKILLTWVADERLCHQLAALMKMKLCDRIVPTMVRAGLGAMVLVLASCGDDPELVLKWEEQQQEIAELQKQHAAAQVKLRTMPRNARAEVRRAEGELRMR